MSDADSASGTGKKAPIFKSLDAADDVRSLETSEIESLCMNCEKSGVTRLLLTKIPMFQEVIIMSFYCPHCHTRNNEIQPGAPIQDKGVRYTIHVQSAEYLNRLVVKGDSAVVCIPELDFEIPSNTQKGTITTVESILAQAIGDLEKDQPIRMTLQPDVATKLNVFIDKLRHCLELQQPFSVVLDDVTGNSFVENTYAPEPDPNLTCVLYDRTESQDIQSGVSTEPLSQSTKCQVPDESQEEGDNAVHQDEVLTFHTNCTNCQSPSDVRMKLVDIPHFKQVVIMATNCDYCGHKSNEVKSGAGVSEYGTRINLKLTDPSDLSRDILKAETATISIPELDFELQSGTLGGRFTTIEGLLTQAKNQLKQAHPFAVGDSCTGSQLSGFLDELDQVIQGNRLDVHVILDDPAGNSYIQNVYAPDADPEMKVEKYGRSFEQNEELGLNDMKTENYIGTDSASSERKLCQS